MVPFRGRCVACSRTSVPWLLFTLVAVIFVALFLLLSGPSANAKLRIALFFLQNVPFIVGSDASEQAIVERANVFNIDLFSLARSSADDDSCVVPLDDFQNIYAHFAIVLAVWSCLGLLYLLSALLGCCPAPPSPAEAGKSSESVAEPLLPQDEFEPAEPSPSLNANVMDGGDSAYHRQSRGRRLCHDVLFHSQPRRAVFVGAAVQAFLLSYTSFTALALELVSCRRVGQQLVLSAAPSTECWSGAHLVWGAVGWLVLIVLSLGAPALLLLVLCRHREDLQRLIDYHERRAKALQQWLRTESQNYASSLAGALRTFSLSRTLSSSVPGVENPSERDVAMIVRFERFYLGYTRRNYFYRSLLLFAVSGC